MKELGSMTRESRDSKPINSDHMLETSFKIKKKEEDSLTGPTDSFIQVNGKMGKNTE